MLCIFIILILFFRKVQTAKDALQSNSGYTYLINKLRIIEHNFKHTIQESPTQYSTINHTNISIVCYGLGLPSCSRIARYQLALLLILCDQYRVTCEVYDPAFTTIDTQVLKALGFKVLTQNEEGKREVKGQTLFFMPHCGKELYNNLLWANWTPYALPLCIIIGNSFTSIINKLPTRFMKQHYHFIQEASSITKEYPIGSLTDYDDVFNDMSIHIVPVESIKSKTKDFWLKNKEPTYENCVAEIVRKVNIIKLNKSCGT